MRLAGLLIALCLGLGAVIVALGVDLGAPGRASDRPPSSPGTSVIVIGGSPLLDRPAPDFTLRDLDGRTVSLADYRGRPVIVNFWASWCEPCKVEFPIFQAAREAHAPDGLEILGVVHDDDPGAAAAFVEAEGAPWPSLLDPGEVAWSAYGGVALPTSFFIDRQGIVRAVSFGPPLSGTLDSQLELIL